MRFEWSPHKNAWLREHRGISFDEIIVHLGRGDVWKTSRHPNRKKYPHQSIAFVIVNDYVYLVPFEVVGEVIVLRTIIPSRKATRQYRSEKEHPT
ncbi:MAG: toxin [Betaproteobacteria bacterium]|nr:toxin [Betaproteobacteria bacterium]